MIVLQNLGPIMQIWIRQDTEIHESEIQCSIYNNAHSMTA